MHDDFLQLGVRDGWGSPVPFGVHARDQRQHLYVIGQTGAGKTTLLRNLLLQHIAAGQGVGLLDPHGDLAADVLAHLPPWRADHLVYFNPADLDFPIGFNPLARVPRDQRHLVVSGIVEAFKSLWRDSWGPRLEYILQHALAALMECPNTTLLGLNRLLTDPAYRRWVLNQVADPFLRQFWAGEYESYDPRFQREAIAPIQNKVGQFLLSPVLRNLLGQVRSKIDFRFLMDHQRLFIANLSRGQLGLDKSNLLGSLLTTQFQLAAMTRATLPEAERRDFYLVIDEFQNFSTDAFAAILAEARKYRLCLTLAHQYTAQLSEPVREAVFGNVGTMIAFRVGAADAGRLESEFGQAFAAGQFVGLDPFEVLVRPLPSASPAQPFPGRTLPPLPHPPGRPDKLIAHCRQRFATPRAVVEAKLNRWLSG